MNLPPPVKVAIAHRTNTAVVSHSTLSVIPLTSYERWKAAFLTLLVWWIGAVLMVPVPVLHFILVPLALVGGLIAFVFRICMTHRRPLVEIRCPNCQTELLLKQSAFRWPIYEMCNACRTELKITPEESNVQAIF